MIRIVNVNDELSVREVRNNNKVSIYVIDNLEELLLSTVKTNDYFYSEWVFDDNYIISYSRGCMVNQIPIKIEAAYSIKRKTLVDLSNQKTREMLENMLICRRGFDLTNILTEINSNDLGILPDAERNVLRDYLTQGNEEISNESIKEYILKKYPKLAEFSKLEGKLSIAEYLTIVKELKTSTIWLNAMPQDVEDLKNQKSELSHNKTLVKTI